MDTLLASVCADAAHQTLGAMSAVCISTSADEQQSVSHPHGCALNAASPSLQVACGMPCLRICRTSVVGPTAVHRRKYIPWRRGSRYCTVSAMDPQHRASSSRCCWQALCIHTASSAPGHSSSSKLLTVPNRVPRSLFSTRRNLVGSCASFAGLTSSAEL